jgi:hypothetical protein
MGVVEAERVRFIPDHYGSSRSTSSTSKWESVKGRKEAQGNRVVGNCHSIMDTCMYVVCK